MRRTLRISSFVNKYLTNLKRINPLKIKPKSFLLRIGFEPTLGMTQFLSLKVASR